jgi:hypothetical protein
MILNDGYALTPCRWPRNIPVPGCLECLIGIIHGLLFGGCSTRTAHGCCTTGGAPSDKAGNTTRRHPGI